MAAVVGGTTGQHTTTGDPAKVSIGWGKFIAVGVPILAAIGWAYEALHGEIVRLDDKLTPTMQDVASIKPQIAYQKEALDKQGAQVQSLATQSAVINTKLDDVLDRLPAKGKAK